MGNQSLNTLADANGEDEQENGIKLCRIFLGYLGHARSYKGGRVVCLIDDDS